MLSNIKVRPFGLFKSSVGSRTFLRGSTTLLVTTAILVTIGCEGFTIHLNKQLGKPLEFTQTRACPNDKNIYFSSNANRYKQRYHLSAITDGESQVLVSHNKILEVSNGTIKQVQQIEENSNNEQEILSNLVLALTVGALTGLGVSLFKLSIDEVRQFAYSLDLVQFHASAFQAAFIPAAGGLIVSLLALTGDFSPGIRGHVAEVDAECLSPKREEKSPLRYLRKTSAAIVSSGTS
jgi:hypothetical protein